MRRMKEREKEREADARDRQREKEELDEIKRRLMEEGHPDPEAELAKVLYCFLLSNVGSSQKKNLIILSY